MATRRSTRAASSQRALSPTTTATPVRTARRSGNVGLPASRIGPTNLAYGSGDVGHMSRQARHHEQSLDSLLQSIEQRPPVETASVTTTGRGRGRPRSTASTNNPNKSYNVEESIFGGVQGLDSSSISHLSDHGMNTQHDESILDEQEEEEEEESSPPRVRRQAANNANNLYAQNIHHQQVPQDPQDQASFQARISDFFHDLSRKSIWQDKRWNLLALFILLLALFGNYRVPIETESGISHRWQFPTSFSTPHWISHPINAIGEALSPDVVHDLNARLAIATEEINTIKKQLKHDSQAMHKLENINSDTVDDLSSGLSATRAEIENIKKQSKNDAKAVQKLELTIQKLEQALSRATSRAGTSQGLSTRLNHWSHSTGAVVVPKYTSQNYQFPSMNHWVPTRFFRYLIGNPVQAPNGPEAALTKWEEHGDCWCTPKDGDDGNGGSIGILSSSMIYSDTVVVEHIGVEGSLQPGAAPRQMELWAYFEDFNVYDIAKQYAREHLGSYPAEQEDMGWIRVATWTYDLEASEASQSFPVQLDLKGFGYGSDRWIVRAVSNYGAEYTCFYRVKLHGEIVSQ